jgi:hypothetical protein
MSFGATGLAKEKFWRIVVKKRNNSLRATPSPRQMRFPVETKDQPCGHLESAMFCPVSFLSPDTCVHLQKMCMYLAFNL